METSHEQSVEDTGDTEMVDDEGRGWPEPSGPCKEADMEALPPPLEGMGPTPQALDGDAVSPKEDAFLMQPASQSEGPAAGSHSPMSKAGTVSGEMAGLSIVSPSQPELVEGETPP